MRRRAVWAGVGSSPAPKRAHEIVTLSGRLSWGEGCTQPTGILAEEARNRPARIMLGSQAKCDAPPQSPALEENMFKDEHPEVQHLVRELLLLRRHNLQFKEGDPQNGLLLFAEAALVCLALERFVRAVLGADAGEKDTLYNLLEKAVSKGLFRVPWDDQQEGIKKIVAVRNTLLHANYEQAARGAGCASPGEYFQRQFASEVESMFKVADDIVNQIDPETGRPRS